MSKKRLTIEEMKAIEPNLVQVEKYIEKENYFAGISEEDVYWHRIWIRVKIIQDRMIGFGAINSELRNSECWDDWYKHIEKLTTNMK